jgi:HD-GYP domain-containing protein (c-di-GMP phosphodiesterase class II)/putative methionine-R-sulfoxide reductase with GAF domain
MEKNKHQFNNEAFIKLANRLDVARMGVEQALITIADTVAQTLDVKQVSIWRFMPPSLEARCVAISKPSELQTQREPVDLTPYSAYLMALQTQSSISVLDVAKDQRLETLPKEFWLGSNIKSSLHVPIRVTNKIHGFLRLDSREERVWQQEDIQFCDHIASLVSQVFLSDDVMLRNERLDMLSSLATDINHSFSLPTLLNDLVLKATVALDCSSGILYSANPENKEIVSVAGANVASKQIGHVTRYGEDVAGKVAETGRDILIADSNTSGDVGEKARKKATRITILAVPLRTYDKVTGVLQVTRQDGMHPFTEHDRDVLAQFANFASLAFEKNNLTEHGIHLTQFQNSLAKIIQTTSLSASDTDTLETATEYVSQAFMVPSVAIRIGEVASVRGLPSDIDRHIETELQKRSKQYDLITAVSDLNTNDGGYADLATIMMRMNVRAFILKPIRLNRDRTGFICVASKSPRTWTQEEIRMVEIAGHQIGLSIEGMKFYQNIHQLNDLVRRLTSSTAALNRLVSLDEIIPMIGQGAVQLSNANRLALVLREQGEMVRASWTFGIPRPEINKVIEKDGKQLLSLFKDKREPIVVHDLAKSVLPKSFSDYISTSGIEFVRITPILHSGNVIGVIAALDESPVDWHSWEREAMVTYANTASLALQSIWMYEQLEKGYIDMALALANTVDARESEIKTISMRLAEWSQYTAQMLGLPDEDQELVRWAALLHDIGKVEVPNDVLQKPGPLSAEERKVIEHYPVKSETLLSSSTRYQRVGKILRFLRERYDGKGYPDKKKGDDIPMAARILAVADAYASMIDNRPYRKAHSHEEAVQEIMKNSGKQFDPAVVNAFLQTVSNGAAIH